MLRATSTFLSHFPKRASLALVHPLLAPRDFRDVRGWCGVGQFHVFARSPNTDYAKVLTKKKGDVVDLKDAIIDKLKLDATPNCVRLLREVEGGAAVPLDSYKSLVSQDVQEGTSVLVEFVPPVLPPQGAAESSAFENCKRLYAALRVAELEPIPSSRSSLIKLPKGVLWPQLGKEPLFVRDFYCGLYEGALSSCDPTCTSKHRKFIIRGNSGIGKSGFGSYMLWRAVQAGRTVVYTSDREAMSFIFHSSGRVEVFLRGALEKRAMDVLYLPSTVFICDSIKPPVVKAFTVFITFPSHERIYQYFKLVDCRMLTLPVFFRHEVKDMLHTCFPQLVPEEALVWELYRKWGGIVRYVLAKHDQSSQNMLIGSITSTIPDELMVHMNANMVEESKSSHHLLHFKPEGEKGGEFSNPHSIDSYMVARTELASSYVATEIFEEMERRRSRWLKYAHL